MIGLQGQNTLCATPGNLEVADDEDRRLVKYPILHPWVVLAPGCPDRSCDVVVDGAQPQWQTTVICLEEWVSVHMVLLPRRFAAVTMGLGGS
jgi:hypothetical protein